MLSIITPVYNGEAFIEKCIHAVLEQHCDDLEHIIIDGGSKDQTAEVIRRYADQHPSIRWVSEKDRGQSDAMNKGIQMAKGEVLGILNVDDFYEPNTLNRVVEIFQDLPEPSFVTGNCNLWNDAGEIFEVNKPKDLNFLNLVSWTSPIPYNPSAYFYHKCLHDAIGLYEIDEHYAMDLDFILKAVQVANLVYVDEMWGNYRQIEGTKTVSSGQADQAKQHRIRVLEKHRQSLPLIQQWQAAFGVSVIYKFRYFSSHPQDILPVLQSRLFRGIESKFQ
ncbi:MAG: glycosyltransferase [Leptolyngbyaceae cyanobacterium SM1_3_5]|nr:glycosyltransferase [Leptolyngbyaceae cyanobacterium SM1_3_5]